MTRAVQDGRRCGSGLAAANDCDTRHFRRVRFSGNGRLGEEGREARKLFSCDRSCGKGGTEDDAAVQDGRRCGSGTVQPRMIALQGFALNAQGSDERGR